MRDSLELATTPLTPAIGAIIDNIDLSSNLDDKTVEAIRSIWLDRGVVFFRGQNITNEQFWVFMRRFGNPMREEVLGTTDDTAADMKPWNSAHTRAATARWHSDTTSLAKPTTATAIRMVKSPPCGGDTCWSSMYAAYDALSTPMKKFLDGLCAVHSVQQTYDQLESHESLRAGKDDFKRNYSERHPYEQVHPVVVSHPETGRKALYVSEYATTKIVDLPSHESTAILSMLFRHIESPHYTMRWKWSDNDVALWDNRSVQHFAVPDYKTDRILERIVLSGDEIAR